MFWNKGRLCWKIAKLFYFCHLKKVVRPETFWTLLRVSRLVDITARGDFLGLCDQKSSYKHVSDFGRLRSYGHFMIPVQAVVWTASYGNSWRVMYSTWWLIVCFASIIFANWLVHLATASPVSLSRHVDVTYSMRGRWGAWVGMRLASVLHDSATTTTTTTTCSKTVIT